MKLTTRRKIGSLLLSGSFGGAVLEEPLLQNSVSFLKWFQFFYFSLKKQLIQQKVWYDSSKEAGVRKEHYQTYPNNKQRVASPLNILLA